MLVVFAKSIRSFVGAVFFAVLSLIAFQLYLLSGPCELCDRVSFKYRALEEIFRYTAFNCALAEFKTNGAEVVIPYGKDIQQSLYKEELMEMTEAAIELCLPGKVDNYYSSVHGLNSVQLMSAFYEPDNRVLVIPGLLSPQFVVFRGDRMFIVD
ncbi:hypothetical protein NDN16_00440 [Aureimonas altamirensis]|uniref:hypothetical protein n=1 Tax=Aureimonas altamirensis TaxID=370622 RepID=UPI0020370006|nr:hypothetical protein [Aureimonas altamirensis]MCM2502133.1 hypothetical protein [Aureimonas altamirensis]